MNMHVKPMIVRMAREADLPSILDLIRQPDFNSSAVTLEEARTVWKKMADYPAYHTLVAEDDRGIIGTVAVILIDHLGHMATRIALVENVIVLAEARNLGVGKAMVAEAGRIATEAGAYKMILATGMKRAGAHQFYETLGFERYGYSYGLPLKEVMQ